MEIVNEQDLKLEMTETQQMEMVDQVHEQLRLELLDMEAALHPKILEYFVMQVTIKIHYHQLNELLNVEMGSEQDQRNVMIATPHLEMDAWAFAHQLRQAGCAQVEVQHQKILA